MRSTPAERRKWFMDGIKLGVIAWFLLMCIGALTACATARPLPEIRTVEVRVPVDDPACAREAVRSLGPTPAYPDTDEALRAAANAFEGAQLLVAGRLLRIAREAMLEGALRACAAGR